LPEKGVKEERRGLVECIGRPYRKSALGWVGEGRYQPTRA